MPTRVTSNRIFDAIQEFLHCHNDKTALRLLLSTAGRHLRERTTTYDGVDIDGDGEGPIDAAEWIVRRRGLLAPLGTGTVERVLQAGLRSKHVFVRRQAVGTALGRVTTLLRWLIDQPWRAQQLRCRVRRRKRSPLLGKSLAKHRSAYVGDRLFPESGPPISSLRHCRVVDHVRALWEGPKQACRLGGLPGVSPSSSASRRRASRSGEEQRFGSPADWEVPSARAGSAGGVGLRSGLGCGWARTGAVSWWPVGQPAVRPLSLCRMAPCTLRASSEAT